jgi:hypothetical protein
MEIDIPKFGQTWKYPCGKWLSKSKGDCQLEVELYTKSKPTGIYTLRKKSEEISFGKYRKKIRTSKTSGVGTEANVFIEIYGLEKSIEQVILCGKTNRKGKFQIGSVDKFVLELEDVEEEIEKIRIGHEDHVEIRHLLMWSMIHQLSIVSIMVG